MSALITFACVTLAGCVVVGIAAAVAGSRKQRSTALAAPLLSDDYYPEPEELVPPKTGSTVREWGEYFDEQNRRRKLDARKGQP